MDRQNPENTETLAENLRTWADGDSLDMAAVELLITHGEWLTRPDFQRNLEPYFDANGRPATAIYWQKVSGALNRGSLPASSSAATVLRIALSLTNSLPVDLSDVVGLDAANTAAVLRALAVATQHTDRITVTLAPRQLPGWLKEGS
ncbi:hypothetical protein SAMN05421803_11578 [Nocardiopsis flavescens]|uniref:Uncharacterized protein n=1 Tax=Nocardiopsis flavescens TaxID=758803 RepID=A0A1M6QIT7_9ACTN|nr:hypothetical protein [Nocardiopsis flavescens]SHK20088.1 hypothetical protein SAMN05421803_11578 [Nocardiopsis flavescens]